MNTQVALWLIAASPAEQALSCQPWTRLQMILFGPALGRLQGGKRLLGANGGNQQDWVAQGVLMEGQKLLQVLQAEIPEVPLQGQQSML